LADPLRYLTKNSVPINPGKFDFSNVKDCSLPIKRKYLPKPKKGEIYGTFNNDMCFERGLEKLKKIKGVDVNVLDSHTIKVTLKRKSDDALEEQVNGAIRSSKGYVEVELDTINVLNSGKGKKKEDSGVLDTPFYG
jgi:hypothetical protein